MIQMLSIGGLGRIIRSPIGMAVGAIAIVAGSYLIGQKVGYSKGEAAQVIKQVEADKEASAKIRERVEDALQDIGIDADSHDVDRVLKGLAGID